MSLLTFIRLREANLLRCRGTWHDENEWTLTDWATAAAGEMGEACNVVKKLRRVSSDTDYSLDQSADLREALADEIADTVIYLDLLAARAGFSLAGIIRKKFNETSEKVGSEVRL